MISLIKDTLELVQQQELEHMDESVTKETEKTLQSMHIHPRSVLQLVYHTIRDLDFMRLKHPFK